MVRESLGVCDVLLTSLGISQRCESSRVLRALLVSLNQWVLLGCSIALLAKAVCPPLGDTVNLGESSGAGGAWVGLPQQVEALVISTVFYNLRDVVFHHSAVALNESPGAVVRRDEAARL